MDNKRIWELEVKAAEIRKNVIDTVIHAGCGHPGGSLSSAEIFAALFFEIMKLDPSRPDWPERDRFILSKGHCAVGLFSVMSLKGFFGRDHLMTFRQNGSLLGGHPDMRKVPGVEMSTGSLGHGLSVGVGMTLAARIQEKAHRVFVLLGDGETQEGSIWEAALAAGNFHMDQLTAIVDRNRLQIDGPTEETIRLEPYEDKWKSFGWGVKSIDGHSMKEVVSAFSSLPIEKGKPSVIIADTVKGKGVSFMEHSVPWHGGAPKGDLATQAQTEINNRLSELVKRVLA